MMIQKLLAGNDMRTLCLYTAGFPYGLGEQFLETEIKYLADLFERVFIIPNNASGTKRAIPENVTILHLKHESYSTIKGLRHLGWWVFSNLSEIRKAPDKKYFLSTVLRSGYQAKCLYDLLEKNDLIQNTVHYTYWFNEQSTLLAILKSQNKISGYISRAHGFDLYEERNENGHIPFRAFQLKRASKLFLISKHGLNYISSKYPQHRHKYQLSLLGVEKPTSQQLNIEHSNNAYHVVSCSRVVDIKRVYLIVKALSTIKKISIKWTHFGDGPLYMETKEEATKVLLPNISWTMPGMVPNSDVLDFYKTNPVDCFINVSSSEGLPVSIMEATSFGIPIMATDVGGTNEIVNEQTGILLPANPSIEEIASNLIDLLSSKSRSISFRKGVYQYWDENFNAAHNYTKFCETLKKLQ